MPKQHIDIEEVLAKSDPEPELPPDFHDTLARVIREKKKTAWWPTPIAVGMAAAAVCMCVVLATHRIPQSVRMTAVPETGTSAPAGHVPAATDPSNPSQRSFITKARAASHVQPRFTAYHAIDIPNHFPGQRRRIVFTGAPVPKPLQVVAAWSGQTVDTGFTEPVVVTTGAAWEQLWRRVSTSPVPTVDFETTAILGVTGEGVVRIESVHLKNNRLAIAVTRTDKLHTQPKVRTYHFVAVRAGVRE
jgi:hypothetical protein